MDREVSGEYIYKLDGGGRRSLAFTERRLVGERRGVYILEQGKRIGMTG